jgi:hypothetical protein
MVRENSSSESCKQYANSLGKLNVLAERCHVVSIQRSILKMYETQRLKYHGTEQEPERSSVGRTTEDFFRGHGGQGPLLSKNKRLIGVPGKRATKSVEMALATI